MAIYRMGFMAHGKDYGKHSRMESVDIFMKDDEDPHNINSPINLESRDPRWEGYDLVDIEVIPD